MVTKPRYSFIISFNEEQEKLRQEFFKEMVEKKILVSNPEIYLRGMMAYKGE